jgi:hypothetical protein
VTRKPRSAPSPQDTQRARLVEEFVLLDKQVRDFKPSSLRHAKLRELIIGWYPKLPPGDEITAQGLTADVVISARDHVRSVTLEGRRKLFKLWGARSFIERAYVYMKSLPDPLDENRLYSSPAPSGPRHLRVISKARQTQAA